jgi:hypothetical protein
MRAVLVFACLLALINALCNPTVTPGGQICDDRTDWTNANGGVSTETASLGVADFTPLSSVTTVLGKTLAFAPNPQDKRSVPGSWSTWSEGYANDIVYTNGPDTVTFTFTSGAVFSFGMYFESNDFGAHTFTITLNDGSTLSQSFLGSAGAGFLGWVNLPITSFTVACDTGFDYAWGRMFEGCSGICGDPHITGLDGSRYDFMAEANAVVAIVSDPIVEINALFQPGKRFQGRTHLGETCFRVCDQTVQIDDSGDVLLNGVVQKTRSVAVPGLSVTPLPSPKHGSFLYNVRAGAWSAVLMRADDHLDMLSLTNLLDSTSQSTHGILGVTLRDHITQNKTACQRKEEGGCDLPGKWREYEVLGDLCSTDWTYSEFAGQKNCPALRASVIRELEQKAAKSARSAPQVSVKRDNSPCANANTCKP